jgi:4-diphosphocytidyl-2-C-methyl-D-erythritol kinase
MRSRLAHAKINLALVVGPHRDDGKHEVVTVLQRVALADRIELGSADALSVRGYEDDTIVTSVLRALAASVGCEPGWQVEIEKAIPIAAGLGGGSSDAAAALVLANELLPDPLPPAKLAALAATIGADVPFFLRAGAQLGRGDGTLLTELPLPRDYHVVLVLPKGVEKASTAEVYAQFDDREGHLGFEERAEMLAAALASAMDAPDLARLPANDLTSSPLAGELLDLGAFRADVTGAGPCVYGLFTAQADAEEARRRLERFGSVWITAPC